MPVTDIDSLVAELSNLRVRVAQLEQAAATDPRSQRDTEDTEEPFQSGDRVRIKNKVRRPATWNTSIPWDQQAAQRATVTHNYKGQVHFTTDNGVSTWRARNNLQHE